MSDDEDKLNENLEKYKWMIRPCVVYNDEYSECTSFRGRFHQYFIYGETLKCSEWKTDYNKCKKWESSGDKNAANEVIESEKVRVRQRLKAHYENDIWTNRTEPPEDWNKPLPERILKRQENSLLALHARGEVPEAPDGCLGTVFTTAPPALIPAAKHLPLNRLVSSINKTGKFQIKLTGPQ